MFNPQSLVTDAFVDHLVGRFRQAFPGNHSELEGVLTLACRTSLETLANCDAAYHDINHTIMVTDVGQCILWGRLSSQGDISPEDWLHAIIAMLFHDIGYLRGLLKDDQTGDYLCNYCLLYTSPSPRDKRQTRMPSSA